MPLNGAALPLRALQCSRNLRRFLARSQRADGKLFDSTRSRGRPLTFRIGEEQVIEGLEAAVRTISQGERAKATVPAALAYGSRGFPGRVPADMDLLFDLELVTIRGAALDA